MPFIIVLIYLTHLQQVLIFIPETLISVGGFSFLEEIYAVWDETVGPLNLKPLKTGDSHVHATE